MTAFAIIIGCIAFMIVVASVRGNPGRGVADAAHAILTQESRSCTGNFFIDEDVLRKAGVTDFSKYQVTPGGELLPDLFVEANVTKP